MNQVNCKYGKAVKMEKKLLDLVNGDLDDSMCKLYESGKIKDLKSVLDNIENTINEFKKIINE